jgi:hypothetical protein
MLIVVPYRSHASAGQNSAPVIGRCGLTAVAHAEAVTRSLPDAALTRLILFTVVTSFRCAPGQRANATTSLMLSQRLCDGGGRGQRIIRRVMKRIF